MSGATGNMNPSSDEVDKKQDVDRVEQGSFDGKAIASKDLPWVVIQLPAPSAAVCTALWRGQNTMTSEHGALMPQGKDFKNFIESWFGWQHQEIDDEGSNPRTDSVEQDTF